MPTINDHPTTTITFYFRVVVCDLITFFTIFASSTRNARRMLHTVHEPREVEK
jgi:hypothetical protein